MKKMKKICSMLNDEVSVSQLIEEYLELTLRNNITFEEFITYIETDHSELIAEEFRKKFRFREK